MYKLLQRKQIEDSIRQNMEQTLQDRVTRYLQVRQHWIMPGTHFAAPSAECTLLFRDGHFYGCIALTQAVAEALVKFLCEKNRWKPDNKFENNVNKLFKRKFISPELKDALEKIWDNRDDYHHLNKNIAKDRYELENIAREKIRLLSEVEREVFACDVIDGKIRPRKTKYWKGIDDKT